MSLLYSIPFIDEATVRALSWTLIHSLWQGMLLAILACSVLFFTKRASPVLRYNLLSASILVFVTGIVVTFFIELTSIIPGTAEVIPELKSGMTARFNDSIPGKERITFAGRITNVFNENAHRVVLVWLAIVLLQCVRLSIGLYGVFQLKRRHTFSAGAYWNERIKILSSRLKLGKQVKLLQSGIATVPAVIGFFKPVILFPAGLLNSLPPEEVEAILVHELAHIRRKDYLVNMLQHIVDIVFFFNPAVRWVSALIKQERENCCDDIAIRQTVDKQNYINALISFGEYNGLTKPFLAHAFFAGESNQLINRVKRIIYNNNKTLNNMEKKFLAAGMVLSSVFIFAFSYGNLQPKDLPKNVASTNSGISIATRAMPGSLILKDTLPEKKVDQGSRLNGTINTTLKGKRYKFVTNNGQVKELYVDGKKIPNERLHEYKRITDQVMAEAASDMARSEMELLQSREELKEAQLDLAASAKEMEASAAELEEAQIEIEQAQRELIEQTKQAGEDMRRDMDQAQKELEQNAKELASAKLEMEQAHKDMEVDMKEARLQLAQAKKEIEQAKIDIEQSKKDIARARKDIEASEKLQDAIIADYIKEGLIKDKGELSSYKLNSEELIINGVKQPAAVHKKFKDKFVKGSTTIMMNNN